MGESGGNDCRVCLRCGKIMGATASYCISCGADLSAVPVAGMQGAVDPLRFRASLQSDARPTAAMAPVAYPLTPPQPRTAQTPGNSHAVPPTASPGYRRYQVAYRQRRTDGMAVASLVCALTSFVLFPLIPAVAAIVTGFVSRERIRKNEGELEGGGLALAGILVGAANVIISLAILLIVLFVALSW